MPVIPLVDINRNAWRENPDAGIVMIAVFHTARMSPVPVMAVVMRIPARVIPVIVMPVIWLPGIPVYRIVVPVPGRAPGNIGRKENIPYKRPGSYLIRGSV